MVGAPCTLTLTRPSVDRTLLIPSLRYPKRARRGLRWQHHQVGEVEDLTPLLSLCVFSLSFLGANTYLYRLAARSLLLPSVAQRPPSLFLRGSVNGSIERARLHEGPPPVRSAAVLLFANVVLRTYLPGSIWCVGLCCHRWLRENISLCTHLQHGDTSSVTECSAFFFVCCVQASATPWFISANCEADQDACLPCLWYV